VNATAEESCDCEPTPSQKLPKRGAHWSAYRQASSAEQRLSALRNFNV
jgi:hypothetical protein